MCESSRKALPLKTTNDDLNHNRGLNVGMGHVRALMLFTVSRTP